MAESLPADRVSGTLPVDRRGLIIATVYGLAAFGGVVETISSNSLVRWLLGLLFAWAVTSWCVSDARQRGRPLISVLQMIMFLTWIVSVPIYLISTRGWRGVAYTVMHTIGLYAITMFFVLATYYLVYSPPTMTPPMP